MRKAAALTFALGWACADEPADVTARFESRVDPSAPCQLPTETASAARSRTTETDEGQSTATWTAGEACRRTYRLETTAPSTVIPSPREVVEPEGLPFVRTNDVLFDALYALAMVEVRENSVDSIQTNGFNGGAPIDCPPGGCFETGEHWTYVWTRDISYSVDLGLAALDPRRARNSLEFKTSPPRGGGDRRIVQDTGTGGSYPISTDRVVWSLGARRLLQFLDGDARTTFRDLALETLRATSAQDRAVAFDDATGLYRGEQSFLDWREQSYPLWVRGDVVHVGMSKALSTNVGHLSLLELASELSAEVADAEAAARYAAQATELRAAIREHLWLQDAQLLSTYLVTELDPLPARRFDALGLSLAILFDVVDPEDARAMLSAYPVMPLGPPVIWPQQPGVAIYHNRAQWPFVTAYWLRAARKARHGAALVHGVDGLIRLTATHLSNMENYEMVTGQVELIDEPWTGPVVNSPRQLWSVAGYAAMVHEVVFGLEATPDGLLVQPYLPGPLARRVFADADRIVLNRFPYRGRDLTVVIHRPDAPLTDDDVAFVLDGYLLNGRDAAPPLRAPAIRSGSVLEVFLKPEPAPDSDLTTIADPTDPRQIFPPPSPTISSFEADAAGLTLSLRVPDLDDVTMTIHRDGVPVATDVDGAERWTDIDPGFRERSVCYTAETTYRGADLPSQRSRPVCWWGPEDRRVRTWAASELEATGGALIDAHGRRHRANWGAPEDRIVAADFRPSVSGPHLIQLTYANAIGPTNTGITCAVKRLEVRDLQSNTTVAAGYVFFPHTVLWSLWRRTNSVRAELEAGRAYDILVFEDAHAHNMSELEHFSAYTGGAGGSDGRHNRANIGDVTVSALAE